MVPIIPDRVADLIESQLPPRVTAADRRAAGARAVFQLCRTPLTAQAREFAIAELAAANKILGAHNPGLIVTLGGAS